MVEINNGFTREAAHQATALIVDRFGWQAEADARYSVVNGRLVTAASAAAKRKEGRKPLSPKATAFENRTGYRSAQRIVQEDAVPRIKAARSWSDLHATLAEVGIRYDIVGTNGVTLTVDDERVKASSIDRAITRTQVENVSAHSSHAVRRFVTYRVIPILIDLPTRSAPTSTVQNASAGGSSSKYVASSVPSRLALHGKKANRRNLRQAKFSHR